jgi:AcrR family transcriptional regulator
MPKTTTTNKEALISGALAVLNEAHDADGLTVDALASRLRMSKSTLYKHFDGLNELTYAAIERLCTQTETDLANVFTAGTPMDTFLDVAALYGAYAERVPSALLVNRHKLPAHARMRLENAEDRLSERMFRAAMGAGASSTVAHGVRHAYDGVVRWLRTVPAEERRGRVADLTASLRRTLA